MNISEQSDLEILRILGERLKSLRLRQNLTQEELSERACLSISTIKNLEKGKGRLDSLIGVLRELNKLDSLDNFIPEIMISPLELAKNQGKERKRAKRRVQVIEEKNEESW